ncbi:hypothetical protein BIV57_00585 [Mangrovactinospora gilvigrisea]|uniref:Uncharacterized protein n=1 Tax=Mangrovactinospora gilvigrisea TaxID=1428644 RepID=A0A1J7BL11_9ACTN|nr:hypothetical protein [Mangrovactinospora gilvigrisea]OIV39375.1 hypothetical protein BIV57_00585 [Mangrovactinospora gilvigrisea]
MRHTERIERWRQVLDAEKHGADLVRALAPYAGLPPRAAEGATKVLLGALLEAFEELPADPDPRTVEERLGHHGDQPHADEADNGAAVGAGRVLGERIEQLAAALTSDQLKESATALAVPRSMAEHRLRALRRRAQRETGPVVFGSVEDWHRDERMQDAVIEDQLSAAAAANPGTWSPRQRGAVAGAVAEQLKRVAAVLAETCAYPVPPALSWRSVGKRGGLEADVRLPGALAPVGVTATPDERDAGEERGALLFPGPDAEAGWRWQLGWPVVGRGPQSYDSGGAASPAHARFRAERAAADLAAAGGHVRALMDGRLLVPHPRTAPLPEQQLRHFDLPEVLEHVLDIWGADPLCSTEPLPALPHRSTGGEGLSMVAWLGEEMLLPLPAPDEPENRAPVGPDLVAFWRSHGAAVTEPARIYLSAAAQADAGTASVGVRHRAGMHALFAAAAGDLSFELALEDELAPPESGDWTSLLDADTLTHHLQHRAPGQSPVPGLTPGQLAAVRAQIGQAVAVLVHDGFTAWHGNARPEVFRPPAFSAAHRDAERRAHDATRVPEVPDAVVAIRADADPERRGPHATFSYKVEYAAPPHIQMSVGADWGTAVCLPGRHLLDGRPVLAINDSDQQGRPVRIQTIDVVAYFDAGMHGWRAWAEDRTATVTWNNDQPAVTLDEP